MRKSCQSKLSPQGETDCWRFHADEEFFSFLWGGWKNPGKFIFSRTAKYDPQVWMKASVSGKSVKLHPQMWCVGISCFILAQLLRSRVMIQNMSFWQTAFHLMDRCKLKFGASRFNLASRYFRFSNAQNSLCRIKFLWRAFRAQHKCPGTALWHKVAMWEFQPTLQKDWFQKLVSTSVTSVRIRISASLMSSACSRLGATVF